MTSDRKEYKKQWYQRNKERLRELTKEYRQNNRERVNEWRKRYRQTHRKQIAEYDRQYNQRIKQEVLSHYSLLNLGYPVCGCCQEDDPSKLEIDHMRGGGSAHRKSVKRRGGTPFYHWLKSNGYPPNYQTLCRDCNNKKRRWDREYKNEYKSEDTGRMEGMQLTGCRRKVTCYST